MNEFVISALVVPSIRRPSNEFLYRLPFLNAEPANAHPCFIGVQHTREMLQFDDSLMNHEKKIATILSAQSQNIQQDQTMCFFSSATRIFAISRQGTA
jgi:hypothetical protein